MVKIWLMLNANNYLCLQSISVGEMGMYYCGCCTYFLPEDERNAIAINKEIQHILAKQRKKERREIKLLLLGEMILSVFYLNCIKTFTLIHFKLSCGKGYKNKHTK